MPLWCWNYNLTNYEYIHIVTGQRSSIFFSIHFLYIVNWYGKRIQPSFLLGCAPQISLITVSWATLRAAWCSRYISIMWFKKSVLDTSRISWCSNSSYTEKCQWPNCRYETSMKMYNAFSAFLKLKIWPLVFLPIHCKLDMSSQSKFGTWKWVLGNWRWLALQLPRHQLSDDWSIKI